MKNSEIIADKAHPYSLEVISHIGETRSHTILRHCFGVLKTRLSAKLKTEY